VGLYHGQLAARQRHEVQDSFMQNRLRVMVATNAFGLGIDKPDLRFVLHHQMPAGLDAYYQESGRAGRDGEPAVCTLLYQHGDKAVQQFFLANRYPALNDLLSVYLKLHEPPESPANGWTADSLAAALGTSSKKLLVALSSLRHQRVVGKARDGRLRLLRSGLAEGAIQALAVSYQERREEDRAMLELMVAYAQTGRCRWERLLDRLAAKPPSFDTCGSCDNSRRAAKRLAQQTSPEAADSEPTAAAEAAFIADQPVRVKRYGRGVVSAADALSVTVKFPNGEQRCFDPGYVTPLGGARAAAKPRRSQAIVVAEPPAVPAAA
jgi:ATP-dependent DNA helicase RecQ